MLMFVCAWQPRAEERWDAAPAARHSLHSKQQEHTAMNIIYNMLICLVICEHGYGIISVSEVPAAQPALS